MSFFRDVKWFFEDMHQANKELVSDVRQVGKEFRNDMKDLVKEHNPTLGDAVEKTDRIAQAIGNVIKAKPFPGPMTTVPDMRKLLKDTHSLINPGESTYKRGDHLKVTRLGLYTHQGLYIGNDEVIHYQDGEVKVDSLDSFQKVGEVSIVNSVTIYPIETIINRAFSRLGESNYNLVFNNCEHFVNWCKSGSNTTDSI
ncbi:lecithin retinol acyltransferase family protein [Litchfieldia alkalitelluris]|uniref:lecithin retinol acyltransferase family protein n=1 Tax=Litchfieldia alkalitelluris TaxID=304268 RepID=UPI0009971123|nr:lecithin retinol acyltransferase family protein [Litchfieldia alkalitelluris]